MSPWIDTSTLQPGVRHPDNDQLYNALDCCLTVEIFEEIVKARPMPPLVYDFSRALQAPALAMMRRGFRIDTYERDKGLAALRERREELDADLQVLARAVWDRELNPNSPPQLKKFLYFVMGLPEQYKFDKGVKKVSTNRESLEKLDLYLYARPFVNLILAIRDLDQQVEDFEQALEGGRYYTSFNIAGTETWRFSSSKSARGSGGNLQNKRRDDDIASGALSLRRPFTADPGFKLCEIDLEQAESREVGWDCFVIFGDEEYLNACESGDLHTTVAKMTWPELEWTDDPKHDRKIAEGLFYRNNSYRDMSKKLGHGCLTADHEVLTPEGWVPIYTKPQIIMAWRDHKSQFEQVSNWIDKEWSDEMISVEGTSISLLMTADHRVLYSRDGVNGRIHETRADHFPRVGALPLGDGFVGGNFTITPQIARLIAAYQCDGYRDSNKTITFHMRKERKYWRLENLAIAARFQFGLRANNKATISGDVGWWPKCAGAYLLQWPIKALIAYINEHKHWDGHISATAQCLFSTNREHLEWLQTIGRLLGIGGNFQKPNVSGFGSLVHKLQQNNRKMAAISSLVYRAEIAQIQVYCPTVMSGGFYVRRNGKISVTGNSNYFGQPPTMARHAKIPVKMAQAFQERYFGAFPAIPRWHRHRAQELQLKQRVVNSFGVERTFFGRPNDDSTLREAIAHGPQSSTAMRTNLGMWRIWHFMPEVQLMAQKHDSVTFQFPEGLDAEIIPRALSLMSTPLQHEGRTFDVPCEAKVGFNWGGYDERLNPNGMKKWRPGVPDTRKRLEGLERPL